MNLENALVKFLRMEITEALKTIIFYFEDTSSLEAFINSSDLWIRLFNDFYSEEIFKKIEFN